MVQTKNLLGTVPISYLMTKIFKASVLWFQNCASSLIKTSSRRLKTLKMLDICCLAKEIL